jgi:competence protein ComEA
MAMGAVVAMLMACACLVASAPAQAAGAESAGVVNVNTASAQQLQLLPGIGAKKAQAIVELRGKKPFGSVDELLQVKGISTKLLDRIRGQVSLKGDTTLRPAPKKKPARSKRAD